MDSNLIFALSLSIIFAAVIGVIRFNIIERSYYPFIYDIWLVIIVELLVHFAGRSVSANSIVNIFSIIDFLLFTWLFYNWSLFKRNKRLLYAFVLVFVAAWVILTFFIRGFQYNNWHFRLLYSFVMIFFSVSYFNKLVVGERGNMLRNSKFLICLGLIFFYTFFTVVCATELSFFGSKISDQFRVSLQKINIFSNVFVNLLYALAVLWIPRKKTFTTVY
ncbi:MAG TPA: hypothetical protein VK644_03360 [Chitinophagaceae bacterium]|nr:hypothetical protein [Chitinophagaceae bacterium]